MRLTLASKSGADQDNLTPSGERLINCYVSPAPEGALSRFVIRSVPGLRDFSALPGPFFRAMRRVEDTLYAISAGGLYQVNQNGTNTLLTAVADDMNTSMSGHRADLTITTDGNYQLWSVGALTEPAGGRLSDEGSVAFLDQFTLIGERDGREIEWTDVGDPSGRDGLNFATAEGKDDKIVRVMSLGSYLMVFKQLSTEVWANTQLGGASAFARVPGAVLETGLLSFNLAAKAKAAAFFVGQDKVAYRTTGGQPVPISTPALDDALNASEPTHCFYYEDRGHRFFVIRFADRPAWVYDDSMSDPLSNRVFWHERSSGVDHGPWDIIAAEFCYGRWVLASRLGGLFTPGTVPVDAGSPLRRTVVSRTLLLPGKNGMTVDEVELFGRFGHAEIEETAPNWITDENGFPIRNEAGDYISPEEQGPVETTKRPVRMWFRVSKDGAHTWGPPKYKDVGRLGHYDARVSHTAFGQSRKFNLELNVTDPSEVSWLSEANVEAS